MRGTLHASSSIAILWLAAGCGGPAGGLDGGGGFDGGSADSGAVVDARAEGDAGLADAVDPDAGSDAGAPSVCPPRAPFGTAAGDVSADFTVFDCDGNAHTLYELCETRVVWLFEFADWCPPCRAFAMSSANDVYDETLAAHPGEFEGWMVISETSSFGSPTAATCVDVRDRYGAHMPVLIDPDGALQAALGVPANEIHVVLDRGARIDWVGHYAGDEVQARIDAAFAP